MVTARFRASSLAYMKEPEKESWTGKGASVDRDSHGAVDAGPLAQGLEAVFLSRSRISVKITQKPSGKEQSRGSQNVETVHQA